MVTSPFTLHATRYTTLRKLFSVDHEGKGCQVWRWVALLAFAVIEKSFSIVVDDSI